MRYPTRLGVIGVMGLLTTFGLVTPARSVEYRLQVVSLFESGFVSFLNAGELRNGASGPGLDRLEATLDRGGIPAGAVLFDRRVQPLRATLMGPWGGARVVPAFKPAGEGPTLADEVVWDGKPGERSVWLVSPTMRSIQELYHVALKGGGALRHFQPYAMPVHATPAAAVAFPLNFLWAHEERGTVWDKYVSKSLDLRDGIGTVVGVNFNAIFPDQVYIVVSQAAEPTTYKAVLVWRERTLDRESPSIPGVIMPR
jgi:hypothetical protein